MPELSVVTAVYNAMPYLPETVRSILEQTHQDFRFILVDDGSTDDSAKFIESLADPRIVFRRQKNAGPAVARNTALELVDTEYFAVIDADDVALPQRFERQLQFMREHPEVGLAGTQIEYVGDAGRRGFSSPLPTSHEEILHDLLHLKHGIAHCSVIARTQLVKQVGGYPNDAPVYGCEDWGLFFKMLEVSRLANMSETLQLYRVNPRSLTGTGTRMARIREWCSYLADSFQRRHSGQPEQSFDAFAQRREKRPAWERVKERFGFYAYNQYRQALAEILCSSPALGYARLAYASCFNPGRAIDRVRRGFARKLGLAGR